MTISSKGYGGSGQSIDTTAWSTVSPNSGSAPHVISGLGATVTSAVNRTVSIAVGAAQGGGVFDSVTVTETVTHEAASVTTNPRWDAIVLHRDWEDTSGSTKGKTTLKVVKGTTNSATPAYPATLENNPGVVADHVLYLVPVMNTGVGTPVPVGAYAAGSALYWPRTSMDGLDPARFTYGQEVIKYGPQGSTILVRRGSDASPVWEDLLTPTWTVTSLASGLAGSGRAPRVALFGGKIHLSGGIVPTSPGARFAVDGGVGNNYELLHLPAWAVPTSPVYFGGSLGNTGFTFAAGQSGNWLQAHVYLNSTPVIYLDGLSYRI